MQKWNPNIKAEQTHFARFVIQQSSDEMLLNIRSEALRKYLPVKGTYSFGGYEVNDVGEILLQVQALYDTLLTFEPSLRFSLEPQHNYTMPIAQDIRSVSEILARGEANCIEIVSLMSALLIHVGLNPVVLIIGNIQKDLPTHAILGFWLEGQTSPALKVDSDFIVGNLNSLGFCEPSGILQQPSVPFDDACAMALQFLPSDLKDKLNSVVTNAGSSKANIEVPSNIGILYGIDIRKAMQDYTSLLPVIAIMGAKGGVGKTIIAARLSELIAETSNDVLLLDFDIENAGSTVFHRERIAHGLPPVKTVYDHTMPHAKGFKTSQSEENLNLWDVTAPYLNDNNLGRVYMIPARAQHVTGTFEVIANIEYRERNAILAKVTDELIERAGMAQRIGCVIIDCGAGNNPVYSAALNRAKYGIVVATPEDVCVQQLSIIRGELKVRFPRANLQRIHLVVNRVRSHLDVLKWNVHKPVGYIRESSDLTSDYYRNAVYFDLGYDDFSLDIRNSLSSILESQDQNLLPSEYDIWLGKWIDLIQRHQLVQKLLISKDLNRRVMQNKFTPIVLGVLLILFTVLFTWSFDAHSVDEFGQNITRNIWESGSIASADSVHTTLMEATMGITFVRFVGLVMLIVMFIGLVFSFIKYKIWKRRKKLLNDLAKISMKDRKDIQDYILKILRPGKPQLPDHHFQHDEKVEIDALATKLKSMFQPGKDALLWLRNIMDTEIMRYRQKEKAARSEVRIEKHI